MSHGEDPYGPKPSKWLLDMFSKEPSEQSDDMTPPNEADVKAVAERLLNECAADIDGIWMQPKVSEIKQVCTRLLELEAENKRLANVPVKWNEDIYNEGYKACEIELDALKAELKAANERCGKLGDALDKITEGVDESLLLDEELHKEWGKLKTLVDLGREALAQSASPKEIAQQREEKQKAAAGLIDKWSKEPGDYDEKTIEALEKREGE